MTAQLTRELLPPLEGVVKGAAVLEDVGHWLAVSEQVRAAYPGLVRELDALVVQRNILHPGDLGRRRLCHHESQLCICR
jgi:hypothetical protein